MTQEQVLAWYQPLGFEETEVEDSTDPVLGLDIGNGDYLLLTDSDGLMPENLTQTVTLAYYSAEGIFQWSNYFKNSHLLKELWMSGTSFEQRLEILKLYHKSAKAN